MNIYIQAIQKILFPDQPEEQDGFWGAKSQAALDALKAVPTPIVAGNVPPFEGMQPDATDTKRHINDRGLELVKHFEALYLKAYQDEVGVWTIGWGHTGLVHQDGTVYRGRTITEEQAEALLKYDMNVFERRVDALISEPLTEDEYSALVSFDFNTGGLEKSTLRKVLNDGDKAATAGQFMRWDKAGGVRLKGLTRRRISEKRLFQGQEKYICDLNDPELRDIYS